MKTFWVASVFCTALLLYGNKAQDYYNYDYKGNTNRNSTCGCICDSKLKSRSNVPVTPKPCEAKIVTAAASTCSINGWNNTGCLDCVDYTKYIKHPYWGTLSPYVQDRLAKNTVNNEVRGCFLMNDKTDGLDSCFVGLGRSFKSWYKTCTRCGF